jgi:hypothetical protein
MARRLVFVALLAIMFAVGIAWAAPGDPFGGDDSGSIPPDTVTQKCEAKVGKAAAKYVKCVFACHAQRAKGKLATADAEDGCEDTCKTSCTNKFAVITGCPPCLTPTSVSTYGDSLRTSTDNNNGTVYCAN